MRRVLVVTVACALPLLAAGCTVPIGAIAGIGVDGQGRLVGYLRVCEDHIDGATLYHDESDDLGTWSATNPVTDFARWSLTEPDDGWKSDVPLGTLTPGAEHYLYGWTVDNSSSAANATFTLADLTSLKPGQVMYWSGRTNDAVTKDIPTVTSEDDFRRDACKIMG